MNEEILRSFRVVATAGSLSKAAHILRLSQPTVSRHIQQLEQEVGTSLLDRSSRPPKVTPAGAMVAEFARHTLRDWNALKQAFFARSAITANVEVASSTVPAKILVLSAVAHFLHHYPAISVHVTVVNSQKVIQAVQEETVDIGFAGLKPDDPSWLLGIVGQDEVCLVLPNRSPYRNWTSVIDLDQLQSLTFVERRQGSGTQQTAFRALEERGMVPHFHVVCQVDSHQELIEAVAMGMGAGFASRQVVDKMCLPQVKTVRLQGGPIMRNLYAICKRPLKDLDTTALLWQYIQTQTQVMDDI